jgi:anti-sigma factor RsiW
MVLLSMTCDDVDESDLDVRYVAGTLAPAEAEAFEEHFFACERCWSLVQQGLALRAVAVDDASARISAATGAAPGVPPNARAPVALSRARIETRHSRGWSAWRSGALAAAALLVAVGITRLIPRDGPPVVDAERGAQLSLPVTASRPSADSLVARWPRVAGAVRYRVRMFTASGAMLVDRESPDTSAVQLPSRLRKPNGGGPPIAHLFWSVEALDVRGTVIAKSPLTAASGKRQ